MTRSSAKGSAHAGKAVKASVATYADHEIITPPFPLRSYVHRVTDKNAHDDPVARAEQELANLSGEFDNWMNEECSQLERARQLIRDNGVTPQTTDALFRAAHDIKGDAATFGYPIAGAAADSLCRVIEHCVDFASVPMDLVDYHINAIQAIIREHDRINSADISKALLKKLRSVADEYLTYINQDRPEHLEAIRAPSLVPLD